MDISFASDGTLKGLGTDTTRKKIAINKTWIQRLHITRQIQRELFLFHRWQTTSTGILVRAVKAKACPNALKRKSYCPLGDLCFPLKPEDTCTPNRINLQEIKTVDTLYEVRKNSAWNFRRTYHDNISTFSLISPGFNQSLSIVCGVHLISAPMEIIWLRNHNWAVCPKT